MPSPCAALWRHSASCAIDALGQRLHSMMGKETQLTLCRPRRPLPLMLPRTRPAQRPPSASSALRREPCSCIRLSRVMHAQAASHLGHFRADTELTLKVAEVREQLLGRQLRVQGQVQSAVRAPCRQVELGYGVKLMHHGPNVATASAEPGSRRPDGVQEPQSVLLAANS